MERIKHYFPNLTEKQLNQFTRLKPLYEDWNSKINVISRKDIDHFYERHVLHSLAIAKIYPFETDKKVMDLGCGGGFPGIPLAIIFPACQFVLVDSIKKKLTVAQAVIDALGLKNITTHWGRAEEVKEKFDTIVTRAVAPFQKLLTWTRGKTKHLIALKGGDLNYEISAVANIKKKIKVTDIADFYEEDFFETKKVIDIALS